MYRHIYKFRQQWSGQLPNLAQFRSSAMVDFSDKIGDAKAVLFRISYLASHYIENTTKYLAFYI